MKKTTVTGGKETRDAFRKITSNLGPALNKVSRLAMVPMLKEARALAPKDSGALRKSLSIRRVKGSPSLAPGHWIGARGRSLRIIHLAEFGRPDDENGVGGYPGSRFMTRAYEATKGNVQDIIAEQWPRILEERIAYLKSKGIGKFKL